MLKNKKIFYLILILIYPKPTLSMDIQPGASELSKPYKKKFNQIKVEIENAINSLNYTNLSWKKVFDHIYQAAINIIKLGLKLNVDPEKKRQFFENLIIYHKEKMNEIISNNYRVTDFRDRLNGIYSSINLELQPNLDLSADEKNLYKNFLEKTSSLTKINLNVGIKYKLINKLILRLHYLMINVRYREYPPTYFFSTGAFALETFLFAFGLIVWPFIVGPLLIDCEGNQNEEKEAAYLTYGESEVECYGDITNPDIRNVSKYSLLTFLFIWVLAIILDVKVDRLTLERSIELFDAKYDFVDKVEDKINEVKNYKIKKH